VQKLMRREKILDRTRRTTKPEVYKPSGVSEAPLA